MTNGYYELDEYNADRSCGRCNVEADYYVHELGFRCADCAAVEGVVDQ